MELLYHHARPVEHSPFGVVRQVPDPVDGEDDTFEAAYRWLETRVGFYPLFLAVGSTLDDVAMTGYANQWRRVVGWGRDSSVLGPAGKAPNLALFSFAEMPAGGVFSDFDHWHIVLNANWRRGISAYETTLVLKRSWRTSYWLRKAGRDPHSVQLVVPELDLRRADAVWVRNRATKGELERRGFAHVEVRRLPVGDR